MQYGDIYFSETSAIGESKYIFLQQNSLRQRWAKPGNGHFLIAETGFGSGLNFLCSWKLWHESTTPGTCLHYFACENHPLLFKDIQRLHKLWPQFSHYSKQLLKHYRDHSKGIHRFHLGDKTRPVILDLLYGDAQTLLKSLNRTSHSGVDAWFLDGFSPRKNPEMWSSKLCNAIAALSKPGTTLSSYTVAGDIRRALSRVGFEITPKRGYATKRHMLTGVFKGPTVTEKKSTSPWFILLRQKRPLSKSVTIIGAGLAGCSTAFALANKGWQVSLIEREDNVAQMASGNSQAILHCRISKKITAPTQFMLQAYLYAADLYNSLQRSSEIDFQWHQTGMIQLACTHQQQLRFDSIMANQEYSQQILRLISSQEASQLANIELVHGGIYLPHSGWLNPRRLCQALCLHPNIHTFLNTQALKLVKENQHWYLWAKAGKSKLKMLGHSEAVVIANSLDAKCFNQSRHYPLIPNRGQLSYFSASCNSKKINTVLCSNGYIIPAWKGLHSIGGSYTPGCVDGTMQTADHRKNLRLLKNIAPQIYADFIQQPAPDGRAAIRCSGPDYLPLIGPVENREESKKQYKDLRRNAGKVITAPGVYEEGLYINVAHGSHGITTTPLAAEYLASLINGEPLPLQNELINSLHPVRFLIRELKKQKLGLPVSE